MNARTIGSPLRAAALPLVIMVAAACGTSESPSPIPSIDTGIPSSAPSADASAGPDASSTPSTNPTPLLVDLINSTAAKVRLEVDDRTGSLVEATSGSPGDGASVPPDAPTAMNVDPSTIRVTWSAGPCDSEPAIIIDPDRLVLVQPPCPDPSDSIALDRIVDLRFSAPTDAHSFRVVIQEGRDTSA